VESFNDAARWMCTAAANLANKVLVEAMEASRRQPSKKGPGDN